MKNRWVVVTDLGSLKAYKLDYTPLTQTPRLQLVETFENRDAHTRLLDQVTDLAGRFSKGARPNGSTGAMSSGERHNIELERRKRCIRQLAARVNHLLRQPAVDGCYFAASKEINHQILAALDPAARAKIEKVVAADLTKTDKSELLRHFLEQG